MSTARGLPVGGPADNGDAQFASFATATYAELVAQLVAITGDVAAAQHAAGEALAWAGRSWQELHRAPDAQLRTRWTAMLAADRMAPRVTPGRLPDTGNPEDAVVVEALALLPLAQRQVLVLHYMAGVTVEELSAVSGVPADRVEDDLDEGLMKLAETIVWAEEAPLDDDTDPRLDWTADVLADAASRLVAAIGLPEGADPWSALK